MVGIQEIDLASIKPSPKQPKQRAKDVTVLAESIKAMGVIQPIHVVYRIPNKGANYYEIVAGHRRWAAAKIAGLKTIPAIVLEVDKATEQVIRLSENIHRRALTPLEEASAIEVLLKMHRTFDEIAGDLGMSATTVARRARLLSLIPKWRKVIDDQPASGLELIARYDEKRQEALYDRFAGYLPETDRLKAMLAEADHRISSAPWKQDDEALYPEAGACSKCEKRSDCQAHLFHDDVAKAPKEAMCLDPVCWDTKRKAFIDAKRAALGAEHGGPVLELQTQFTGNDIPGALRPYQYSRCKKTDKDAKPALILDGPQAGHVVHVQVSQPERVPSRTKKKMAEMSEGERRKARDKALLGRRAMHIMKALREILEKKQPAMRSWATVERTTIMLDLAIQFGIRADNYVSPEAWVLFGDRREKTPDENFDDWWRAMQESLHRPLAAVQKTEQAAKYLPAFEFFATGIMGEDWEALKRDAVAAIPDRRLKEGEPDPFDPGDRAAKTEKKTAKRSTKAKPAKKGSRKSS
jgi:ParB family chromosome partitioning protein